MARRANSKGVRLFWVLGWVVWRLLINLFVDGGVSWCFFVIRVILCAFSFLVVFISFPNGWGSVFDLNRRADYASHFFAINCTCRFARVLFDRPYRRVVSSFLQLFGAKVIENSGSFVTLLCHFLYRRKTFTFVTITTNTCCHGCVAFTVRSLIGNVRRVFRNVQDVNVIRGNNMSLK